MSFVAVVFKIFPYLWPFIKEMLIGKKTWKQAFKENRGKTTTAIVFALSLLLNVVLSVKLTTIAYNYIELSRTSRELERIIQIHEKSKAPDSSPKHPLANEKEVAVEVKKDSKTDKIVKSSAPIKQQLSEVEEIKAEFEKLRKKEAADH